MRPTLGLTAVAASLISFAALAQDARDTSALQTQNPDFIQPAQPPEQTNPGAFAVEDPTARRNVEHVFQHGHRRQGVRQTRSRGL